MAARRAPNREIASELFLAPKAKVTCVIPGHDRDGEELVADELVVAGGPFGFSYVVSRR